MTGGDRVLGGSEGVDSVTLVSTGHGAGLGCG